MICAKMSEPAKDCHPMQALTTANLVERFTMADHDSTGVQKCCTKCLQTKPLSDFHCAARGLHGRQAVCRQCCKEIAAKRYAENREEILGKYLARYHAKQQPIREMKAREKAEKLARPKKPCPGCGETKPLPQFGKDSKRMDSLKVYCKPCQSQRNKATRAKHIEKHRAIEAAWRKANPEKIKKTTTAWRLANEDRARQLVYKWRDANPEKVRESRLKSYALRAATANFRISRALRRRLRDSLRGGKAGRRTFEIIGCTFAEFKKHMERQFLPGMTWNNYGEWHIDHIVPLASFRLTSFDGADTKAAWGLANLRPLWAVDNARKNARRTHLL